jgi:hypothetical protein
MADLVTTPANVKKSSGKAEVVTLGEAIDAGQSAYLDSADGLWYLASATDDEGTLGIMLTSGVAGQQAVVMQTDDGVIDFGAILTVGKMYYASATDGAICGEEDLVATNYTKLLGWATTTSLLKLTFIATGIQR